MKYDVISADCHIDLIWLPPDLFTANASAALKDRMPYVTEGPRGKEWVTKSGASFGLMNGMGSAGRLYEPGKIHRSDRMASEGIYEDGKKGIRRMTDPELRIKDQDRDGIQAEVLYGILGATSRINDDEAAGEMLSISPASATPIPIALPGSPAFQTTTSTPRSARSSVSPGAAAYAGSKSRAGAT